MEALSEILGSLRARGSVYFCDRRTPPWSMEFDKPESASFHMVRRGECWLISDQTLEHLGPGDLVFVEPGRWHKLSSEHPRDRHLNCGMDILLMCGYCRFDGQFRHPLLRSLPALTVIRAEDMSAHPGLKSILDLLGSEFISRRPGSGVIVDKLTEILLVELIRIDFGRDGRQDFIAALNDKKISRVLELIHASPELPWTLATLASEAAMSRASLATRFKSLVGQTVFDYLTGVRMHRAGVLLRTSSLPIHEIASRCGYESDLAFTKTFRRRHDMTPVAFRKTAGPGDEPVSS